MNVNAQFPGSAHDANIWRQSNVSGIMERVYRHDPRNVFFLLGDSGKVNFHVIFLIVYLQNIKLRFSKKTVRICKYQPFIF